MRAMIHFIGFRDDRYWNAVRVFGAPDYIHEAWDTYAANDIAPGDMVVFAEGEANREPRSFTVEAAQSKAARKAKRRTGGPS
ncbi:MAG: hypothetical protein WA948_07380 [Pontixanthobacter sp.]